LQSEYFCQSIGEELYGFSELHSFREPTYEWSNAKYEYERAYVVKSVSDWSK
jgi:hypothetical protein